MKKRLLTLADLYTFCLNTGFSHFSSKESGYELVVHTIDKSFAAEESSMGLLPVHFQACHTLDNLNGSTISEENMEKALPSFALRPVLANIVEVDGEFDFHSHDCEIDKDGNIEYIEKPVGVIRENNNAKLVYDEEKKRTYVEVDGVIYEEYSRAAEILRERKEVDVSVELCILEMSFDAKEKKLELIDFYFNGVTLLGKDVRPGMAGSNVKIEDFSAEKNSLVYAAEQNGVKIEELVAKFESSVQKFTDAVAGLDIKDNQKGGLEQMKLNELLEKYNLKVEDLNFEYESLSDEELEAKFLELFGGMEHQTNTEPKFDENRFTVKIGDLEFSSEISLNDTVSALTTLVNETYGESDNTWYSVEVFENDLIMVDYWNGKAYKQTYSKENDSFMLTGDRIEVYAHYLTKEEEEALAEMRNNYAALEQYKKDAEAEIMDAQKLELLNNPKYSLVSGCAEFKDLVNTRKKYDLDSLEKMAKNIVADYVFEHQSYSIEHTPRKNETRVSPSKPDKKAPYGTLFKNK